MEVVASSAFPWKNKIAFWMPGRGFSRYTKGIRSYYVYLVLYFHLRNLEGCDRDKESRLGS